MFPKTISVLISSCSIGSPLGMKTSEVIVRYMYTYSSKSSARNLSINLPQCHGAHNRWRFLSFRNINTIVSHLASIAHHRIVIRSTVSIFFLPDQAAIPCRNKRQPLIDCQVQASLVSRSIMRYRGPTTQKSKPSLFPQPRLASTFDGQAKANDCLMYTRRVEML